jgi:Cu2+-exporting ATPase
MNVAPALLCGLCGLDCGRSPLHAEIAGECRGFCCPGCMNVYAILFESGILASGIDVRETELFRRSLELGLISAPAQRLAQGPPTLGDAAAEERLFHVSGLWCSACAWLIEHVLRQQPGVLSAEVFFVSDLLKIRYLPQQFPLNKVQESLQRLGYRVEEYSPEAGASDRDKKDLLVRVGVAAFLWVNVMGLNLAVYLGAFDAMPALTQRFLPLLVMLLAQQPGGLSRGPSHLFRYRLCHHDPGAGG